MKFILGFLTGVLFTAALTVAAQGGMDYPVIQFTPYSDITSHVTQDTNSAIVDFYPAGEPLQLYTPYVGGDARYWAATSERRDEWIAVNINGYCPREHLGTVIVLP
jgi:hypothetical protein